MKVSEFASGKDLQTKRKLTNAMNNDFLAFFTPLGIFLKKRKREKEKKKNLETKRSSSTSKARP